VGIPATATGIGGWTVGPVVGRRPAGTARDAVHPGTGARAVLVVVDGRFTGRGLPDPETVARAAAVGSPAVMPMLDAGLLEDGTRWYVTPASPGPVLDPAAGCSPRRAATIVESVARGLAPVHAAGLVHGLVGPNAVIPAAGRHAGRPVGTTLLLDAGVAALLGDRADDLAVASGVSMPVDRGPAADVYALGALLLRLVTAAAAAGPALAALPAPLRDLLSAMLDEHPSRRPTADAVAARLAAMREGLLATGPVELPRSAPVAVQRPASPAPSPRPVASAPASRPVPQVVAAPAPVPSSLAELAGARDVAPRTAVPAPVRAPHTTESPIVVPRSAPAPATSLWTGPVRIAEPSRPGRSRAKRVLLLAGGVGLAGLLIGVVSHLPLGHVDGDQAVAAVAAGNGGLSVAAATSAASASTTSAAAPSATSKRAKHLAVPTSSVIAAPAPAFVQPTRVVPSPLASSATSTTPSRNTTAPITSTGSHSSAPTSTTPSAASSAPVVTSDPVTSQPSTPTGTQTSSDTPTASDSSAPESSAPTVTTSSTPSSDPTTSDPTPSDTPSDSTTTDPPTDTPSVDPSPSGS
jgi:hypothetical protein